MEPFFSFFILLCLSPSIAFAYLDLGTGLLLSSAIALFASALFFFKGIFYKVISLTTGGGG